MGVCPTRVHFQELRDREEDEEADYSFQGIRPLDDSIESMGELARINQLTMAEQVAVIAAPKTAQTETDALDRYDRHSHLKHTLKIYRKLRSGRA
jgi:hypothetical protein